MQKPQGDPEMLRLSDLVMTLGDLFRERKASCSVMSGSQPCLAGGQKVLLRRVRQSTALVPECYHQQRGWGFCSQFPSRLLSPRLPGLCLPGCSSPASLQGQGPRRPRTRGRRPSQNSPQDPPSVPSAGLPGPQSRTQPPPGGPWDGQ